MTTHLNRRAGDRRDNQRKANDRRFHERRSQELHHHKLRFPGFGEQRVQFITRYVFFALGLAFFNLVDFPRPPLISLDIITLAFLAYFIFVSLAFYHAWRQPVHVTRYRLAMWVDVLLVALCVMNDPHGIPPSLAAFVMIVIGNGMRYGLCLFREALIGSFGAAIAALGVRFIFSGHEFSAGLVFLNLFGGIILIYSYILMQRIETARSNLERSNRQDALTGLLNRRGLEETADLLFKDMDAYGGVASVMFADLDHFKAVNDLHGHTMGDETLCRFADVLQKNIRATDISARYGGDEFVVLMPETTAQQGELPARRIQKTFADWVTEAKLPCNASIGLSEAPRDGRDLTQLLTAADAVLYHIKSTRHGGVLCSHQLPAAQLDRTAQG